MNEKIREILAECDNHDLVHLARLIVYEFQDRNLNTIIDEDLFNDWASARSDLLNIMIDVSDAQL